MVGALEEGEARGTAEGGLSSQADATTTAMLRKKLIPLRAAFAAKNAKAYREAMVPLLQDALAQPNAEAVKRFASLEVLASEEANGLQPLVYLSGKNISANATKIDLATVAAVRMSPRLTPLLLGTVTRPPCDPIVREALARPPDDATGLPAGMPGLDDPSGLDCLGTPPEITAFALSDAGVTLPVRSACELIPNNVVYRLDLPGTISTQSVVDFVVEGLPFGSVFETHAYVGGRFQVINVKQFGSSMPVSAQTTTFAARVTTTTGVVRFPITMPIAFGQRHARGIPQMDLESTVELGSTVNWTVYGNGAASPRAWAALASSLPAGLSFAPATGTLAGQGVITGTVAPSALNGNVDLRFTQGTNVLTKRYTFNVGLRIDPVQLATTNTSMNLSRGQTVSILLPAVQGGTGTYTWTVSNLPAGLNLVRNGSSWFISGTFSSTGPFEERYATATVTSGTQSRQVGFRFDSRRPLNVYSQNMILFPSSLVDPAVDCLVVAPIVAGVPFLGGTTWWGCFNLLTAVDTAFYDTSIHNTDADNAERAGFLIDHINAQAYDVVALQEVWDAPLTDAQLDRVLADTAANYRSVVGPLDSVDLLEPSFKISSGLVTLVKGPTPAATADAARTFDSRGGGEDSFANKGFVATKAYLTNSSSEFVWVINTHTHAREPATRADQFIELRNFIASLPGAQTPMNGWPTNLNPVLLMGDLNVVAGTPNVPSLEYSAMLATFPGFRDIAFGDKNFTVSTTPYLPSGSPAGTMPSPGSAYDANWIASDAPASERVTRRLDYLLLRQGTVYSLDVELVEPVVSARMTALCSSTFVMSGLVCHYSDHFGLRANLKFRRT